MKICTRAAMGIFFGWALGALNFASGQDLAVDNKGAMETVDFGSTKMLDEIEQRLKTLPEKPAYLYETSSLSGKISSTWVEMTSGILGTEDLRDKYDEFYTASVQYRSLSETQLVKARNFAERGDIETANHYIAKSERSKQLSSLSNQGAIEVYLGNLDAAKEFADGIYKGSKAAVKYGANFVGMGPVASQAIDAVFDVADFAVKATDIGIKDAAKEVLVDKVASAILDVGLNSLGGKSMSDVLKRGATQGVGQSGLNELLQKVLKSNELRKSIMSVVAQSSAYVANDFVSDQLAQSISAALDAAVAKPTANILPVNQKLKANRALMRNQLTYSGPDNRSPTGRPKVIDTTTNYIAGTIAYGPLSNLSLLATATGFEARRNAANEITSFDMFGIVKGERNSALAVDTGSNASAGNLNWGRWSGTASTITIINSGTYPGHNLHYVFGSAPTNIPTSGSVTYNPVGGTNPTSSGGGTNLSAITQGTFNSGTIGVNFATRGVTVSNLNFSVSTATFNMNGSSTYNSNALFSGSMTGTCTGAACSGAVTGNHIGTLTGPAAAGIALGYQAHTAGTGMVVGAQGFIKQ